MMLVHPRLGQTVRLWYQDRTMPFHGRIGQVVIVSKGKPRNHGVRVGLEIVVVPCGNIRRAE
jgi:hypothetical protein